MISGCKVTLFAAKRRGKYYRKWWKMPGTLVKMSGVAISYLIYFLIFFTITLVVVHAFKA